ncbi:hypothetical protein D3C87_2147940 [compost metagenome]
MVDEADIFCACQFGKADRLLPGRMAVTAIKAHLLIGKHGVVEEEIDVLDQIKHVLVDIARFMFGIGDDGE